MKPRAPVLDVAPHVLAALARAQIRDERLTLDDLVHEVEARRPDVRSAVSKLHQSGLVDALRLRLTMRGFALGVALARRPLPPLRRVANDTSVAA